MAELCFGKLNAVDCRVSAWMLLRMKVDGTMFKKCYFWNIVYVSVRKKHFSIVLLPSAHLLKQDILELIF
jgi:hypothetical protein